MIGAAVLTPARQALLLSGMPESIPSFAVDRACCSGMTAIGLAWKDIRLQLADVVLCGGFESLSTTPFLWPRQRGARPGAVAVKDPLLLRADFIDVAIAAYTGHEAVKRGIGRQAQDAWAAASHRRYFEAEANGYFDFERVPFDADGAKLDADESPRQDSTPEKLATLRTVYDSPTVTAGNAPGLNDGAAFLVLASGRAMRTHGLEPLARIIDYGQAASGATSGSYLPGIVARTLLDRAGTTADDLRRLEINEAFAATPLVSTLELADGDARRAERLRERTNAAGGAVAIGHPLGASGARITMTLINGLRRAGGGLGVAAICGGFGQGDALLVGVE
jgi:acetyl-CoA C-acetyltransferase